MSNVSRIRSQTESGDLERCDLDVDAIAAPDADTDPLALHNALATFEQVQQQKGALVKLRYFAGRMNVKAAAALGVSPSTADRDWRYARAWLAQRLRETEKNLDAFRRQTAHYRLGRCQITVWQGSM